MSSSVTFTYTQPILPFIVYACLFLQGCWEADAYLHLSLTKRQPRKVASYTVIHTYPLVLYSTLLRILVDIFQG